MRKTLIIIIIVLLVVTLGYMLIQNTTIGGLTIFGITGIKEENDNLDTKIQTVSKLSGTDYQRVLTDLSNSAKEFKKAKQSYDEMVSLSTVDQTTVASQLEKYEIEYLWTRIGTHATNEEVVLKIEISSNSTSEATGYYDLNFTVVGSYVGITDFIYDIENDSSLGFKIENFKMIPSTGKDLQATFICKDISINIDVSNLTDSNSKNENKDEANKENSENNTAEGNNQNQDNNETEGNDKNAQENTNLKQGE